MKKVYCIILIAVVAIQTTWAQPDRNTYLRQSTLRGLEYELKAGLSIGGVSPIPLPAEIRSIDSYNPTLLIAIEGNATKWFTNRWGASVGFRVENKGMKTDAKVKNYNMEITADDGGFMKGAWTGNVITKVRNSYLTVPVLATYRISPRWIVKGGCFVSYMADGDFSGSVYDGYIRDGDPTGEKINVTEASYDFYDDVLRFSVGAQMSGVGSSFE